MSMNAFNAINLVTENSNVQADHNTRKSIASTRHTKEIKVDHQHIIKDDLIQDLDLGLDLKKDLNLQQEKMIQLIMINKLGMTTMNPKKDKRSSRSQSNDKTRTD